MLTSKLMGHGKCVSWEPLFKIMLQVPVLFYLIRRSRDFYSISTGVLNEVAEIPILFGLFKHRKDPLVVLSQLVVFDLESRNTDGIRTFTLTI